MQKVNYYTTIPLDQKLNYIDTGDEEYHVILKSNEYAAIIGKLLI